MPIFDYQCQACGHTFDALQKVGADPLRDCPECDQPELKKLLSAPNFHLKGGGWRNSDDGKPKKPDVRPKMGHMFDSPIPHAEHTDDNTGRHDHGQPHSHDHGDHSHDHGPGHGHDH